MITSSLPVAAQPARRRLGTAFEFVRYFAASALALGADVGLFDLSLRIGLPWWAAALLGFVAGAGTAYIASVRWVFDNRAVRNPALELGLFVGVGVLGLLLTEGLLWVAIERLGLGPRTAKIGAAGIVFVFNFVARKAMLFRARPQ